MGTNVAVIDATRIGDLRALAAMARPSQLLLVMVVYVSGVLLSMWRGGATSVADVVVGAALLVPAAVAVHWANEGADAATDAMTDRTRFSGGSGALARSRFEPASLLRWAQLLAAAVAIVAVLLVIAALLPTAGGLLLVIGLAGGLAYSVPPVSLMRRGFGEPFNALLGALILPLFGVAAAQGYVEPLDVVAFLPFTFITTCSVMATAWPDRVADGATGKDTLQVRLDPSRLRTIYGLTALAWAGMVLVVMALDAAPFPLAPLGVLPFVWIGWTWYTRRTSPWPSVAAMVGHIVVMTAAMVMALP